MTKTLHRKLLLLIVFHMMTLAVSGFNKSVPADPSAFESPSQKLAKYRTAFTKDLAEYIKDLKAIRTEVKDIQKDSAPRIDKLVFKLSQNDEMGDKLTALLKKMKGGRLI